MPSTKSPNKLEPDSPTEFVDHPLIKPEALKRRRFQETIFLSAAQKNTLVVLPTGLGKTIIALLLAAYRLEKYPDHQILVLAPTKPLVEQHQMTFTELLTLDPKDLVLLTGSIPPRERYQFWNKGRIIFATPQVVENDLVNARMDAKKISLVVFDEAHRAVGNYAYAFIAQQYLKQAKNPHVLGLTASPGADKAKIQEVCKNLGIQQTEIRSDRSPDVRPYIQQTDVEWRRVDLPPKFQTVKRHLDALYEGQIQILWDAGVFDNDTYLSKAKRKKMLIPRRKLLELQGSIRNEISRHTSPPSQLFAAMAATASAIRLSHALELLETQGLHSLRDYMQRMQTKGKHAGSAKSLKRLLLQPRFITAYKITQELLEVGFEHPKTLELLKIVEAQLKQRIDSRIMVFTQYRDSATLLTDRLKTIPKVVPIRFVGQASRSNDKGLTQKQQSEILEQFRDGLYNVLVATQVAEEGLDIVACDLVVFYDNVPSGIRHIQRRGRTGRQSQGRVIILIAKGTRDEAYYWSAQHKEKSMKTLLKSGVLEPDKPSQRVQDINQLSLDTFPEITPQDKQPEKSTPLKVIIDHRETGSQVVRELVRLELQIDTQALPVGDYVVSDRAVVERKEKDDFVSSLLDGRLFEQCKALKNNYTKPIIVIEGDPFTSTRAVNNEAVRGAIASIILDFQIPLFIVPSPEETARFIRALARREQSTQHRTPKIRGEPVPLSIPEAQEYVVAGIPGIDAKLAKRLLSHFDSLQRLFTAEESELAEIKGIGKKKAQQIHDLITASYQKLTNTSLHKDKEET